VAAPKARKRGRPSGVSDTRDRILASARKLFAHNAVGKISVRAVAADAGVDPALVHHYFGTKEKLFAEAVDLPFDPAAVLAVLHATPVDELGRAVASAILGIWESELGPRLKATLRSAIAGDELPMFGNFLRSVVFTEIATRVDDPPGSGIVRVEFAASQILGAVMARHVMALQPLASLPLERVIDVMAPTLQRYLTGAVPGQAGGRPAD
jgi:AcrR family transcriptional regulator